MSLSVSQRLRRGLRRRTIFLHIGAMKTGTTYLQTLMQANRHALLDAGYLFPGDKWHVQSRAVRDVMGFSVDDPRRAAETEGRWAAVAGEMLEHQGRAAVMSMEFLSFADRTQAARVVESFEGADVHVILTVRDATSAIPTQWQTGCRNGKRLTLPRFIAGVDEVLREGQAAQSSGARMILRTQWAPRMLDTWVPLVGRGRVHVISLPPRTADPRELWHRFAAVTGIPPEVCSETGTDPNPSLGLASTELLRLLNGRLGDLPSYDYDLVVKRRVAREILSTRRPLEPPITLNQRGHRLARRWNRATRGALELHKVALTGSPDELPVEFEADELPQRLPRPSETELLAAAATGRHGMLHWMQLLDESLRTGDRELAMAPLEWGEADRVAATSVPDAWTGADQPVTAAVSELADLVRRAVPQLHAVRDLEVPSTHTW